MKADYNQADLCAPTTDADHMEVVKLDKGRLPFPKGVYRFRSNEEADAWTNFYIRRRLLIAQGVPPEALPSEPPKFCGLRAWLRRVFGPAD
jgi:hypothetical protein